MNAQTYIFAFTITLMSVYNKYIVFIFGIDIEYEILLNCVVFFDERFDKSILLKTFKFQATI